MRKYLLILLTPLTVFGVATVKQIDTIINNSEDYITIAPNNKIVIPYLNTADVTYYAADGLTGLAIGTLGQVLTVNGSGFPAWVDLPSSASPLTTKGDLYTYDTDNQRLPVGADNQILSADSAEATGLKWIDVPVSTTLTTKGDIQTYDSANARLPVGTDNQVLISDSAEVTGLKWVDPPSTSPTTTEGDLILRGATEDERLPIGAVNQLLTSNGTTATWEYAPANPVVNYIPNFNLEINADGYIAYADAAGTIPVDGTGGSPTVTCTRNTTTPLRETGDLRITVDAANRQGEGCSYDFSIDNGMKNQRLLATLWYNSSDANYADADIKFFIYDVTNARLIRVNGEDLQGGKNVHRFSFDSSDSLSYRLIAHISSTNASGYSVYLDEITVQPYKVVEGTISTDWKDYTPSTNGLGTVTFTTARWRRTGDSIQLELNGTTGTTTASEARIGLPSGFVIESGITVATFKGIASPLANTSGNFYHSALATGGDTFINIGIKSSTQNSLTPLNGNTVYGTGQVFSITTLPIKIEGWSGEGALSEDFGGRDITVEAYGNDAEAITANTEDIPFKTFSRGVSTLWTNAGNTGGNTTDAFTTPETGWYDVSGMVNLSTGTVLALRAYVDGSLPTPSVVLAVSDGVASDVAFAGAIYLERGQVLTIRSTAGITLVNDSAHKISILKRSNPQTALDDRAVVAARYTSNNSQSVNNNSPIIYEDFEGDTHGAYSSGIYTIPVNAWYTINCTMDVASNSKAIAIYVNGSETAFNFNAASDSSTVSATTTKPLSRGDTVECRNVSGSSRTLSSNGARNYFSIVREK